MFTTLSCACVLRLTPSTRPLQENLRHLTPDDSPNKRGVSGTVHQGELQAVILLLAPAVPQVIGEIHREGGEAEVQRDASLTGLRVLVEGGRRGGAAQRPGEWRLPAVDMSEHPDVEI